jgi:release factor H-coupled RctB family protein
MSIIKEYGPKVRMVAGDSTWVEGEAIRQLQQTAELPGMINVIGLPDIQPGKGAPSGAAFLSQDMLHPHLVGTDIGCGMGLWSTSLPVRKAKIDRVVEKLQGLDMPWDGDPTAWLEQHGVAPTMYDHTLGTPGRGNHFIELQRVDEVIDAGLLAAAGVSQEHLQVMVHSGSRGYGEAIFNEVASQIGATPVAAGSAVGSDYLAQHDHAVRWAKANRELCATRVCEALNTEIRPILDICHNAVTPVTTNGCACWLHRKGAAPADKGVVIIPGSRGDRSALVLPNADRTDALTSLAHGAGRKITREQARGKLQNRHTKEQLKRNSWGGRLICGEDILIWEEAPECYKSLTSVVGDLEAAGLLTVVAYLRPLVTFKTSEGPREERRSSERSRQHDRRLARQAKYGERS